MDDLDWQNNLPDDLDIEQWSDIARQIESGFLTLLDYFDSDTYSLQAYLAQVDLIDWFPIPYWLPMAEEDLDVEKSAFDELVETFPLKPDVLTDKDRVFRQIMVVYCSELLKAQAALKTGLTEKAWWHCSQASYHHGMSQGYYLKTKPAEDKIRTGRMGGLAKEEKKREAVKSACITHLKDRPSGGWKSPDAAIKAVLPKVKAELGKQREEIDVFGLLVVWLNGDPDVQKAGGFRMGCTKE